LAVASEATLVVASEAAAVVASETPLVASEAALVVASEVALEEALVAASVVASEAALVVTSEEEVAVVRLHRQGVPGNRKSQSRFAVQRHSQEAASLVVLGQLLHRGYLLKRKNGSSNS
jgi:uncharacterized protein YecE (DUF72 family)